MATSYINTGVLGQVVGGSLGTSGLTAGQEFQQFSAGVQRRKRQLSGPSREEREAARQRREERRAQSVEDTAQVAVDQETGQQTVTRPGVEVDTADVKVPSIKVDEQASPAVQAKQQAANEKPVGITQTALATPPPAPAKKTLAPERQYGASDVAFVTAFDQYYQSVQSKNNTSVNRGRGALQSSYQRVLDAAQASGRREYIDIATSAGAGVYQQKDISSRNVGQAKAATASARTAIRGLVDLDTILRESSAAAAAPAAAPSVGTAMRGVRTAIGRTLQTTKVRRGRGFFGGD